MAMVSSCSASGMPRVAQAAVKAFTPAITGASMRASSARTVRARWPKVA